MGNIQEQLSTSVNDGSLFETVFQLYIENGYDHSVIGKELAALHNQGKIDVISEFLSLKHDTAGHKFFTIRHALEGALPEIDEPVLNVMQCVKHLTDQAGQDMAAGMLFPPFIEYCQANGERPDAVLCLAVEQHEKWKNFISPAIIAGTRVNLHNYVVKAINLTKEKNVEIKSRAVLALGRIKYCDDTRLVSMALESLKVIVNVKPNDQLSAAVLRSSYALYLEDKSKQEEVAELIASTLEVRGDITLHSASELFIFEKKTLPNKIRTNLIEAFKDINPEHTGTVNNIDYGLVYMLANDQAAKAVNLLEVLLIKHGANLSISKFDSFSRELLKNQDGALDKTITQWLMSGDSMLGRAALDLVSKFDSKNSVVSVDVNMIKSQPKGIHLFLAKKACGWLFFCPVCAVSFILSLIEYAPDEENDKIIEILFNPLLISYSGSIKEYLQDFDSEAPETIKNVVSKLLTDLDNYHDGLKSVRGIKELEPSISQRETYNRKMNREMSKSYKEARKGSLLSELFGRPSVLLYGNSSIHYIHHGAGKEKTRQVVPLNSLSTSLEYPSLQNLDPNGLEIKLRGFRLEGSAS